MPDDSQLPVKVDDLLGAGRAVEKALEAGEAFLKTLFGPAVSEVGELFADPIRAYRAKRVAAAAAQRLHDVQVTPHRVPGRILLPLLDSASAEDHAELSEKWASLLAAAVSAEGGATFFGAFVDVLRQLSPVEVRVLDWMLDFYDRQGDSDGTGTALDPRTEYERNRFELSELGEFAQSVAECKMIFQNLVRLGLCDDQLDRSGFEASLAGQVILGTRPRRADGFVHELVKLSLFGIEFVRACRFPNDLQVTPSRDPLDATSNDPSEPGDTAHQVRLRTNKAVERFVALGLPFHETVEVLVSASSVVDLRRRLIVTGEPGYGLMAASILEHEPWLTEHINQARALLSKPPLN